MREAVDIVPVLPVCTNGEPRTVRDVVPADFAAVVAVLHEARFERAPTPWRVIAERLGMSYDPGRQWALIRERGLDARGLVQPPRDGSLSLKEAKRVVDHLRNLEEPGLVHFFVWTAYGFGESDGEVVRWCGQTYVHSQGSVDRVETSAASDTAGGQTPSMWIPDTEQWAVHSDWRCLCTYVAGPASLAQAVLADTSLDAIPVGYEDALFTEAAPVPL
jgi:hypothetical protein